MSMTKRLVALAFLASAQVAQAEYGLGYSATDFDPQTHEYKPIYRDWQEGAVLDAATGNYTITYKENDVYFQTTFEPSTKIVPHLSSTWKANGDLIAYHYRLTNDRHSRQNIESLMLLVSNVSTGPDSPPNWDGRVVPTFTDTRLLLSWTYEGQDSLGGLTPGREMRGLGVESTDLPGVATAQLKGAAAVTTWSSMPQGAVGDRVNQLLASDFVPRYAVAPIIVIPTPFAFAPVLTNLQKHVDHDLVSMKLIDPALVARLDSLFDAATAAAQGSNTPALRGDLHALRAALSNERGQEERSENAERKWETEDAGEKSEVSLNRPIAPIAKAVLEFDLHYLERRLIQKDRHQERSDQ